MEPVPAAVDARALWLIELGLQLGQCLSELGDAQAAVPVLRACDQLVPGTRDVVQLLAAAYTDCGRYRSAARVLIRAARLCADTKCRAELLRDAAAAAQRAPAAEGAASSDEEGVAPEEAAMLGSPEVRSAAGTADGSDDDDGTDGTEGSGGGDGWRDDAWGGAAGGVGMQE